MSFNPVREIEEELIEVLEKARDRVLADDLDGEELPPIEVEVPREDEHGDYASNLALSLGGKLEKNPRQLAEEISAEIDSELVERVEVAGPGFINFWLDESWLYGTARHITELGEDYGRTDYGRGERVQVEFVSVNPTGPLHVGHSRGAVVGDTLASIMDRAGFEVEREYLINDAGNQMDLLGRSTYLRYLELFGEEIEMPENSYRGDYVKDIARELRDEHGSKLREIEEEAVEIAREFAYERVLAIIKRDLNDFGIEFDNWFSERTLHEEGRIEKAVETLREKGYIYEEEGATWFAASELGDDKDRVVIKSDGSPTYMGADIAYHQDKVDRGFDKLINVWGADHHGYIDRMKASIEALGYDRDMLEIIIVQMVNLIRGGETLPMSKREGEFVTMRELMEEVGLDAARYFFIMRSTDSHFDFDLDLAREESTDNPVYYIQYAHARICSMLERADEELQADADGAELELLDSEAEKELLEYLACFPEEIREAARLRAPHRLANYIYDLANAFHVFYNKCQVLSDDRQQSLARLKLVQATRQVLVNALDLIGVSAPEEM